MATTNNSKPHVFVTSAPPYGHFEKVKIVASALIDRGYPVTFIAASHHRDAVESTGAVFAPFQGSADYDDKDWPEMYPEWMAMPPGIERFMFEQQNFFIRQMGDQHESLQREFEKFRREKPGEPIIVIHENAFMGASPILTGAPGIKPTAVICLGVTPVVLNSIDHGPFGSLMPPDSSPEGRQRNRAATDGFAGLLAPSHNFYVDHLRALGATADIGFYMDNLVSIPTRYLQMSLRSADYPRSDLPENFNYIGAIPGTGLNTADSLPAWWDEIVAHRKKLVVVSQGSVTVSNDPHDLIVLTIQACADMSDVLVVSTLVKADEIAGFPLPDNARIAKFIPFDELFRYTDVLVNNGGFGTIQQALYAGVPMVLAGEGEDKPETNARTAWCGAAVNLSTQRPTAEKLREAVRRVLDEKEGFRDRLGVLAREARGCDPVGSIVGVVDEFAGV